MTSTISVNINDVQVILGSPSNTETQIYWMSTYHGKTSIILQLSASETELRKLGIPITHSRSAEEIIQDIFTKPKFFDAIVNISQKAIMLDIKRQIEVAKQTLKEYAAFIPQSDIIEI